MTHLSPRAIEALTKGLCKLLFDHGDLDQLSSGKTRAILEKEAASILAALEAEGMVVVPKAVFYEIANRASNMCDPDAAEWMPSIYKIACEAVGEDPTRLLQAAHGGDDAGQ